jgi:DnaK suppressor protein
MRKDDAKKFKKLLEAERERILSDGGVIRDDFSVCDDDRFDEIDQATTDAEQAMMMRLSNREAFVLKKIDGALKRIEDGTYGDCEECGERIDPRRLKARLFVTLCISCKEEQERGEIRTAAGLLHKSLGEAFSRKLA